MATFLCKVLAFSFILTFYLNSVQSSQIFAYYQEDDQQLHISEENGSNLIYGQSAGWATFNNSINSTGWGHVEVKTYSNVPDSVQAYAAGYMEGKLTKNLIEMHLKNVFGTYCNGQEAYCERLKSFLWANKEFMLQQIAKNRARDPYWHQVGLILEQLAGMEDAINGKPANPHTNVTNLFGLYLLNLDGDTEDLEVMFNRTSGLKHVKGGGSCSGLVKLLPNNSDIYVAQVTWSTLESMLRFVKLYDLGYHTLPSGGLVVPKSSFSSYPGKIQSGDDFYILSSGLVIFETTIGNGNRSLYKDIKPDNVVLEWIRSIVSHRLATDGPSWSNVFKKLNSGTYNNQWVIVNMNLYQPKKPLKKGLLTVLEQIPTLIISKDMTDVLKKQDYWPSYNVPYNKEIFKMNGDQETADKFGDFFTYDKTPRALIFKRDHKKVVDMASMIKLMRYNDYKHDNLSKCDCTPPYSGENGISARSDLNPKDGIYPFPVLGHRDHAGTDMKLTNPMMAKSLQFVAIAGPTHDNLPPFQWSKSEFKNISHEGHPDLWMFPTIKTGWTLV